MYYFKSRFLYEVNIYYICSQHFSYIKTNYCLILKNDEQVITFTLFSNTLFFHVKIIFASLANLDLK
jgi:hypothetical protein